MGRQAVTLTNHPNLGMYLSNLGVALRRRFDRTGALADLDEAITVGRQAVTLTPTDHPELGMYLSNLGIALQARFERRGAQVDLDEAITVGRQAVTLTPTNHPNLGIYLSNLGRAPAGPVRAHRVSGRPGVRDGGVRAGRGGVYGDADGARTLRPRLGRPGRGKWELA